MLSVKPGSIKYHFFFESLVWLDLWLNPGLPSHWQTLESYNTLIIRRKQIKHYKQYQKDDIQLDSKSYWNPGKP